MDFLRRILGGGSSGEAASADAKPGDAAVVAEDEAEHDRRLLREEAERLDDELIQRQLRYASRAWVPPAQGGPRRADDAEARPGGE